MRIILPTYGYKRIALLLPLLLLSACLATNHTGVREKLFNGKNLHNWEQVGPATWQVSDAQIVVLSSVGDSMLVSKEKYADFKLSLEFWVDEQVNSGVFIRCAERETFTPFNCYEMNIWDRHPKQEFRTGAIVAQAYPPLAQVETVNKWNRYEILAEGDTILVSVNGVLTARLQDSKHSTGYIALQRANDGEVRFRNIELERL